MLPASETQVATAGNKVTALVHHLDPSFKARGQLVSFINFREEKGWPVSLRDHCYQSTL